MLNYGVNYQNLRIINRNQLKTIDSLEILINKQIFECDIFDITSKFIYFSINNIGLIQPSKSKIEYILRADEKIIDKGYILIN